LFFIYFSDIGITVEYTICSLIESLSSRDNPTRKSELAVCPFVPPWYEYDTELVFIES
jgi:hypothetical protein